MKYFCGFGIFLLSIVHTLTNPVLSQNLLNGPEDIIFDVQNDRILVSNWVSGAIVEIDENLTHSYYKTGLSHAHGMELLGDTLYVASDSRIYGIRLGSAQTLFQIDIPAASRLGHITIDDSLILYATDWNVHKLFRVDIRAQTYTTVVQSGIDTPVGIMLNRAHNRLILCQFIFNTPPHAVSLSNYMVTAMGTAAHDQLDAIVRDPSGNFYLSVWSSGDIIRYNSDFSNNPELISIGHDGPSGLGYNASQDILGVTNYNSNSISLIPISSTYTGDDHQYRFTTFRLHQNYPNPFNPSTVISWQLAVGNLVTLTVFNLTGQKVATLVNERQPAGLHSIEWDASRFASGVYLYQLEAEGFIETKKMILMK